MSDDGDQRLDGLNEERQTREHEVVYIKVEAWGEDAETIARAVDDLRSRTVEAEMPPADDK